MKGKINHSSSNKAKFFFEQLKSLFVTVVIFIFITSAFIEGSIVPTPSMENTIMTGDRLFINKFVFGPSTPTYLPLTNIELPNYRFPGLRDPERNEIIVFRYPGELNEIKDDKIEHWVKRCVALPGDTLEIINKVVFVNGIKSPIPTNINYHIQPILPKNIKNPRIFPNNTKWNEDNYGPLVIPKKGDNIFLTVNNIEKWRTLINREFGRAVVDVDQNNVKINGEKVTSYTITRDYYFMVGDNRDNSLDSRFWGFVPRENIVGTPMIIFWSWDSNIPFSRPLDLLASIRFNRIAKLVK
ncbi:MAG: signal peptidase I [Melioribacteraceae bacterium]|nr:signal peptidase I [Melioribacteraceae bacterium]